MCCKDRPGGILYCALKIGLVDLCMFCKYLSGRILCQAVMIGLVEFCIVM